MKLSYTLFISALISLSADSFAQNPLAPGGGGGGTNAYNPYPNFNPTPIIIYPTNAVLKWYLQIPGSPLHSMLSLSPDGCLYVSVDENPGQEYLYSINTSIIDTNDVSYPLPDNFLNWTYRAAEELITPAITTDGKIYIRGTFVSSNGIIYELPQPFLPPNTFSVGAIAALNPTNGSLSLAFGKNSYKSFSSVAVGNDEAVYTCSGGYVYALTNAPGKINSFTNSEGYIFILNNVGLKWIYRDGPESVNTFQTATPFVGQDGTLYVVNSYSAGPLWAFNSTNGTLKWKTSNSIFASGASEYGPAVGFDGKIYFGSDTNFYAIDPKLPTTNGIMGAKWTYKNSSRGEFTYSPVIGSDGTIYVEFIGFNTNNQLLALDPNTGNLKWKNKIGAGLAKSGVNFKRGSLAVAADGEIYLADSDGLLYSFAPDGQTNWVYATGEQALGSPLIGPDGVVYVESLPYHEGCYIYAFQGQSPIACSAWPEQGRNARRTSAMATASVSSPSMLADGFQFTLNGFTNMPVCPCASSDLKTWTNIGQTILTEGRTNFTDMGTGDYPYRFYRAFPQ